MEVQPTGDEQASASSSSRPCNEQPPATEGEAAAAAQQCGEPSATTQQPLAVSEHSPAAIEQQHCKEQLLATEGEAAAGVPQLGEPSASTQQPLAVSEQSPAVLEQQHLEHLLAAAAVLQPPEQAAAATEAPGALQQELEATIGEREALQRRIESLSAELDFCERKRESLEQKESWLTSELAGRPSPSQRERLPSLQEFFSGKVQANGPQFFGMEEHGDSSSDHQETADSDGDGGEPEYQPCDGFNVADWEEGLDSIGIAKCRLCGFKFPLDVEAIEKHTKECNASEHTRGELLGKCHACGMLLPLNTEEIERHLNVCEMKKAPPVPPVPVPGVPAADGLSLERASEKKRGSSLWSLMLPGNRAGFAATADRQRGHSAAANPAANASGGYRGGAGMR